MVISFVAAAIVTCALVLGVISVHETAFVKNKRPFIRIRLAGIISLLVRTEVLVAILVLVLAALISAIVIFSVMDVLPIYHHLYQWQEFLTSNVAANGLLGIVFGGFLATWIARNYNRPPDCVTSSPSGQFEIDCLRRVSGSS
ncbi:MAG: hypothetical protein GY789_11685 [Hyphomicrobiales bacterium]|nr:hypothetical protein [Hyphomicrobiales bacterium]